MTRAYLPALSPVAPAPPIADPGTAPWLWLGWVLAFCVIELVMYWRRGTSGTFSGLVWRWLDDGPGGVRWRRARWALLAGALGVICWHLLGGAW